MLRTPNTKVKSYSVYPLIVLAFIFSFIPMLSFLTPFLFLLAIARAIVSSISYTFGNLTNDPKIKDALTKAYGEYSKNEKNISEAIVINTKFVSSETQTTFPTQKPEVSSESNSDVVTDISEIIELPFTPNNDVSVGSAPYSCPYCGYGSGTKLEVCPRCKKAW